MHSWFAELIAPDVDDVVAQQALDARRDRARRLKNLQVKTVRRGP